MFMFYCTMRYLSEVIFFWAIKTSNFVIFSNVLKIDCFICKIYVLDCHLGGDCGILSAVIMMFLICFSLTYLNAEFGHLNSDHNRRTH